MTSKERVQACLNHQTTDRVPIFMWFHPGTARHLADLLGIPVSMVGEVMGNDIAQAWVNNNYAMEGITHENEGEGHVDDWGIHWVREGEFNQIVDFPLISATEQQLERYQFPYASLESLLNNMQPILEKRHNLYIGVDVSPCVFEMYWRLRGMERSLLDMIETPALANRMLSRCADFAVALAQESCQRFKPDWLWTGDDVAGQKGLMMHPEKWRELVGPHLRRVFDIGKEHGLPVAYHCCGALRPILPDLIEMGLDVLNPVQCNCPGMNPLELKKEFGKTLTFMGGVDTQGLLPQGSAEQVYKATAGLIDGMTEGGGGYILAASHTIPPETPDENIFALYAAAGVSHEEILARASDCRNKIDTLKCAEPYSVND